MILTLLLACAVDPPPTDDSKPGGEQTIAGTDTSEPETTGEDETTAPPEEEPPEEEPPEEEPPEELPPPDTEWEDLSETYFSLDRVHTIDLQLPEDSLLSLVSDPYTEVPGDMELDGELFEDVNVRLKGKLGSFRSLRHKAGFKVDINDNVPGRTAMGQKKLNLNNMVQDCSCLHDRTAYLLYQAMGVSAPRVGYGWVTVNGEDYGLYALVEAYDDVFLEQRYDQPDGNLYDGDYTLWENGDYSLADFEASAQEFFKLSEGADVGHADVHAVTEAISVGVQAENFSEEVGAVVDLAQFQRFWATEVWVGQWDGYNYNKNNYRVYFNPETGLAELLPWDHDNAFYSGYIPLTAPMGRLSAYCQIEDGECYAGFLDAVAQASAVVEDIGLLDEVYRTMALINPYIAVDPRMERDFASASECQADLQNYIETREIILEGWEL